MIQLNKQEYNSWTKFKSVKSSQINKKEQDLIAKIHSKHFNHDFYYPCSCSPKEWNRWIQDINIIYENGVRDNK